MFIHKLGAEEEPAKETEMATEVDGEPGECGFLETKEKNISRRRWSTLSDAVVWPHEIRSEDRPVEWSR